MFRPLAGTVIDAQDLQSIAADLIGPERPVAGSGLEGRKPFAQTAGTREQVHHPDLRIDVIGHTG